MKAWEYVINTAMLGTDKPMPGNAELPDVVAEIAAMDHGIPSDEVPAALTASARRGLLLH